MRLATAAAVKIEKTTLTLISAVANLPRKQRVHRFTVLLLLIVKVFFFLSLQRYIAFEDSQEGEKKDLQCRLVMLESHTRQLELKTKNYADQSKSVTLYCTSVTHRFYCTGLCYRLGGYPVSSIDSLQVL